MATAKNLKELPQPISVFIRIRPLGEKEKRTSSLEVLNTKELLANLTYQKKYCFDRIFREDTNQHTIYTIVGKSLIDDILSGYTCTVFAYGQTGTGKTYTLLGPPNGLLDCYKNISNLSNSDHLQSELNVDAGLIPRTVVHLFQQVRSLRDPYTVRCSYLEIYNEELRDLLSPAKSSLPLRIYDGQRGHGDVVIHGLECVTVHNEGDVFHLLKKGLSRRSTALDQLSHSHTIFSITVDTQETSLHGEILSKMGKINFVVLAGSENGTVSTEHRSKESVLNQSLVTLGQIIKKLVEKNSFLPFRESKLTRILRDSLGGKAKTTFVSTISCSTSNLEESINTLDYVSKVRTITNKPTACSRISQKLLINRYLEEIDSLRKDLDAVQRGAGVILNSDNYEQLMTSRQTASEQLSQVLASIAEHEKRLIMLEEEKEIVQAEHIALNKSYEETRNQLETTKLEHQKVESEKLRHEYVASAYEKSTANLYNSADGLLKRVKSGAHNESALHEKIQYLYNAAQATNNIRETVNDKIRILGEAALNKYKDHIASSQSFGDKLQSAVEAHRKRQAELFNKLKNNSLTLKETMSTMCDMPSEQATLMVKKCDQILANQYSDFSHSIEDRRRSDLSKLKSITDETLRPELLKSIESIQKLSLHASTISSQLPFDALSNNLKALGASLSQDINLLSLNCSNRKDEKTKRMLISQTREELKKAVTAHIELLKMQLTDHSDNDVQNLKIFSGIENNFVSGTSTICNSFRKDCENFANEHTKFMNTATCDLRVVIDNNGCLADARSDFNNESLSLLSNEMNKTRGDVIEGTVTTFKDIQDHLHTNLRKISDICNEQFEGKIGPSNLETNICEKIICHSQETSNLFRSLTNDIHDVQSQITQTLNDVVELKPTGSTPLRNNTEIPYPLKELTPKEVVVKRFYQSKKEVVNGDVVSSDHPAKKLFDDSRQEKENM